jgi:shikimate dehydrogenase
VLESELPPISAATRYCAVYGRPIRHSASPAMQNAGIAALGLDWRYLAFDVHPGDLRQAIEGARAMKFIGLNLTVPHKLLAMELVDELDASAEKFGAVNTIRFEAEGPDGGWRPIHELPPDRIARVRSRGFNTDAEAVVQSIEEDLGLKLGQTSVVLLGAGGAGRVAALRLALAGVRQIFLVNRTASKAEQILDTIRERHPEIEVHIGYPPGEVDLVVNATSLGLHPEDSLPFDPDQFDLVHTGSVYDMIYRPAETRLLQMARAAGCRIANGIGMLLHQGARALEIWTGRSAPIDIMRQALNRNV